MYTWALHRRLSNETVHNPDSLPSKSLPQFIINKFRFLVMTAAANLLVDW